MSKMNADEALSTIKNVLRPEYTSAEIVEQYEQWDNYDQVMDALGYMGAEKVTNALVKHLADGKRDVDVLDVACGTGRCGVKLREAGFNTIDALDPAQLMLKHAEKTGCYRKFIQDFFPVEKKSIITSSYDVLTASGGLAIGHMKCDCLPEMVRCVKPGGLVVISLREDHLTTVPEYNNRFEPLMKTLEDQGQWKLLEKHLYNQYESFNGVVFTLKITKKE